MSICFFGNGEIGVEILSFLLDSNEKVSVAILHKEEYSRNYAELAKLADENGVQVMHESDLKDASCLKILERMQLTVGVSAFFNYIIRSEVLDLIQYGIINLHTSYLPWNRGSNPNVWSIINDDPVGVSIHLIDSGVDTGPIIAQKLIDVPVHFTAKMLYYKLQECIVRLFKERWPGIKSGRYELIYQNDLEGSVNRRRDLEQLKILDLNEKMTVKEVLNILRACMFPPHPPAFFEVEGDRYDVEITISRREKDC